MTALSIALVGRGSAANDGTGDSARDGALKLNKNTRYLEALAKAAVVSATTTAQPASPSVGDLYIIPAGKTGTDWAGYTTGSLALYCENDGANAWFEITPSEGWKVWVKDTSRMVVHSGSAWVLFGSPTAAMVAEVATKADLKALDVSLGYGSAFVQGRTSAGDGGGGLFRWSASDQSANVTADTAEGVYVAPNSDADGSSGAWVRVHDGTFYPEWFGSSADWGAAFTAMLAAMPSSYGRCKTRAGTQYTISTAITVTGKSFWELDISGSTIIQAYTGGPQITIGSGAALIQDVVIRGEGALVNGGTVNQPFLYTRGLRGLKTLGFRALDIYQFHVWGNPADAYHSYIWTNTCEVTARRQSAGGHSDMVQADGSLGVYYGRGDKFSGDATNVAAEVVVFRLTSSQLSGLSAGSRRFDQLVRIGSQWDTFDWGIKAVDAALVNYEKDDTSRDDQMVGGGVYSEVTSGATQGGGEKWYVGGTCATVTAGTNSRVVQIVAGDNASYGYAQIEVRAHAAGARATPVDVAQTGAGVVQSFHVRRLDIYDFQPSDASQPGVKLSGTISGSVDNVALRGKAGATYQANYTVYNDTGATVLMSIGDNIGGVGHVNTAVLYHPNPGTTVGRYSGVRTDGTPYGAWSSATDRLFGRDTAGAGPAEEISVGGGLEFTGSGGIQRSALTGEVTASAGSNATTVGTMSSAKLAGAGGGATAVPIRGYTPTGTFTDDSAVAMTAFAAGETGTMIVSCGAEHALIGFKCTGTPALYSLSATANVAVTTGTLAGTTGTDGRLTLAIETTTRVITIENRLGGTQTLRLMVIGGY